MFDAGIPIDFVISAQIRIAAQSGVPIMVRQRGDANSGVIILKINLLNGMSRVLTQARYGDELVWSPISDNDLVSEADAERYIERQTAVDPDTWVLEIEDKQGRPWFDGRVVRSGE